MSISEGLYLLFLREKPWLEPFLGGDDIINVEVVDLELLAQSLICGGNFQEFEFFSRNGDHLGSYNFESGKYKREKVRNGWLRRYFTGVEWEKVPVFVHDSSVESALKRIDSDGVRVQYILKRLGGWVTLYRVPLATCFKDHVQSKVDEAKKSNPEVLGV